MSNINRKFIKYVRKNDLSMITKLLDNGADVHMFDDIALKCSVTNGDLPMVSKLLKHGANVHAENDFALKHSIVCNDFLIAAELLENGANIYVDNKSILRRLQYKFNVTLADTIFPYCNSNDYSYFPIEYVQANVTRKKSANNTYREY